MVKFEISLSRRRNLWTTARSANEFGVSHDVDAVITAHRRRLSGDVLDHGFAGDGQGGNSGPQVSVSGSQ